MTTPRRISEHQNGFFLLNFRSVRLVSCLENPHCRIGLMKLEIKSQLMLPDSLISSDLHHLCLTGSSWRITQTHSLYTEVSGFSLDRLCLITNLTGFVDQLFRLSFPKSCVLQHINVGVICLDLTKVPALSSYLVNLYSIGCSEVSNGNLEIHLVSLSSSLIITHQCV
ncbi:hypothetical protein Bca4012_099635 [Brassica carinata]|uniref:Uncharacterized protein n=2 Tax=Brassica cretica TaxID=69181 RepID=A0A8S9LQR6_BRACR|nr:hypothetical protein F2Q68_00044931 [Brassica cretica]KAF3520319.1 hypothetical protein DY000_02061431 [Brassica cretica]